MNFFKLNTQTDFEALCALVGVSEKGAAILQKKANLHFFFARDLRAVAVNILKQDALSVGADVACGKDAVFGGEKRHDVLIFGTQKQLLQLACKEKMQDFGLASLGREMEAFLGEGGGEGGEKSGENLDKFEFSLGEAPLIMGVINHTPDSFNPASRTPLGEVAKRAAKMIEQGASYIDIGAVSSRPGSVYMGGEAEWELVRPLVSELRASGLLGEAKFSLDSFDARCLSHALEAGFVMVNDITADVRLMELAREFDAEYCLMDAGQFARGGTKNGADVGRFLGGESVCESGESGESGEVASDNALEFVSALFADRLFFAEKIGLKKVVLDVGIGFGKTQMQNLALVKHLSHFGKFKKPLLVGASRKSVVDFCSKSSVEERLAGSLFLHLKAVENGARIVRVHDVFETKQTLDMLKAYKGVLF